MAVIARALDFTTFKKKPMKTDMNYKKKIKEKRWFLSFVSVFVAMTMAGCGGGMIGTGTGPESVTDTYQLQNLPERISPAIPKTHLRGEELLPSQPENADAMEEKLNIASRMEGMNSEKSAGWVAINEQLLLANLLRVNAESNATIIDIAFDEIRDRCVNQPIDCTIAGDQIKVKLTQSVINRLIEIVTDWAESLPPDSLVQDERLVALIREQYSSLQDSEVVLGETVYSQLDGAPYDHSLQTSLKRRATLDEEFAVLLWKDEDFHARWNDDGNVAKFDTNAVGFPAREYFYQNNTPSEIVIANNVFAAGDERRLDSYIKLIANDLSNAGVLVEAASIATDLEIFPITNPTSAIVDRHSLFQGQIDNSGGYSTSDNFFLDLSDTSRLVVYTGLRHSFDNVGSLIVGERCLATYDSQGTEVCDEEDFVPVGSVGSSIIDSPYYFEPAGLDALVAVQDAIRWKVEGLPADIKAVSVVSADSGIEFTERELLCRGFRFSTDDVRAFCSATDEQLANTVVLELVDGKPGQIVATANLVQIQ